MDHGYPGSHEPGEKRASRLPLVSFFFGGWENDLNYYPFHIGDFAAHTAHLSWEEDIAYRRMLDWYYLNEKALPLDVMKVARLIRMPKSLPAIQVVLDEFFVQSDDGWHNKRADEELTAMLAKQEQQATKDEHESDRMRRFRERRASLFAALRAVQIVPAWDVPMKELQRLFDTHCNGPATDLQREQNVSGNAPATAIPTPTPINKEPIGSLLAAKRRKQLPPDFCPSPAGMQFAVERGLDVAVELQKFTDFHMAKGSLMLDWQAAWRTWASNAKTFARGAPQANRQVAVEQRNKSILSEWVSKEAEHA